MVEQLAILPHEIIHLIECETLDERSGVAVPGELLLLGDVRDAGTANEAGTGNETVADAARRITRAVRPASAAQRRVPQRSIRRQIRRGGMRATRRGLRLQTPDVGEDEPRVEIGDTVRVGAVDFVGVRDADARRRPESALQPQNVEHRMIDAAHRVGAIIHRGEKRHLGAASFTSQFRGGNGLYDAPRVDQLVRRIELLGAIEKEWSLLGEEERCARIDDELSGVGFDLREVRMDGAVEGEVFGDSPAYITADDGTLGGVRPVVIGCRCA